MFSSADTSWPTFLGRYFMSHEHFSANFLSVCDREMDDSSDVKVLATTALFLYLRNKCKKTSLSTTYNGDNTHQRQQK